MQQINTTDKKAAEEAERQREITNAQQINCPVRNLHKHFQFKFLLFDILGNTSRRVFICSIYTVRSKKQLAWLCLIAKSRC